MNETTKKKRGCLWWSFRLFVVLPAIILISLTAIWVIRHKVAQGRLEERIRERQLAGLPVDDASLRVYYEQRNSVSLTNQWVDVIEFFNSEDMDKRVAGLPLLDKDADPIPPLDQPWQQRAEVEAYLDEVAQQLETVHKLAESDDGVAFPREFRSIMTETPNSDGLVQISRVLQLQHEVALRSEDAEGECQAIEALLGTAVVELHDPMVVGLLRAYHLHNEALDRLKQSIEVGHLNPEQLSQLLTRLSVFEHYEARIRDVFEGEIGCMLPIFENPLYLKDEGLEPPMFSGLGSRAIDANYCLDHLEKIRRFRFSNLGDLAKDAKHWQDTLYADMDNEGFITRADHLITRMFEITVPVAVRAVIAQVMKNRIAQTAIAIRQFEQQFGHLPEQFEELEQVGLDLDTVKPIAGDQFGYRRTEDGAILWAYEPFHWSPDIEQYSEVPDDPPPTTTEEEIEQNGRWVWELKANRQTP